MRVIGGLARGRRILAPRGRVTRPTSDYLREVLFDLLAPQIDGKTFLDLYAGTGAVGIEALSRGAAAAIFVEQNRSALAILYRNLDRSGFRERAVVVPMEVRRYLRRAAIRSEQFDLIFLDPPYLSGDREAALTIIAERQVLAPGGLAILERSARIAQSEVPTGLEHVREVRHGDSALQIYRREI
ncbi:MAG: 16S rRNA (guanine(966)-N(2))-methyltransferase RsmD [Candidatus Methylomirabilota bacterium]|nr:16S rRNA (guanine(966)-N(2))-methyltransferase RsmD [Candidatus Methylomirabilis sp.]NJD68111.1 16S rRNA (guanine(966)-N(2))-methyltransferase RsmD [candidate division NC10 bacterium]PWB48933.1 MAG: 16S rRNA (guanine(966)-N(2))-methyltransferase RsmD [candidate division NC10 bacterium]